MLLAHGHILVHQDPQVLLCKAAFQPVDYQPVLVPGVTPSKGQGFTFPFAKLHGIPASPFLQLFKVSLNGSTAF